MACSIATVFGRGPVKLQILMMMAAISILPACSSLTEGTSQNIAVSTNPSGANCALLRQGIVIARVNPTPGTVRIDKTKHDITVECEKDGFQKASFFNKSDVAGMTAANLLIPGAAVGWIIDSATGADNKYTGSVHLELQPNGTKPPPTAPASRTDATGKPVS